MIDLDYIGAHALAFVLANPSLTEDDLRTALACMIEATLSTAASYLDKYDNWVDRSEGTDVSRLKEQLAVIDANLKRIKVSPPNAVKDSVESE